MRYMLLIYGDQTMWTTVRGRQHAGMQAYDEYSKWLD